MVKKSDMTKAPKPEAPEVEEVKTPEPEKEIKVTVHPKFTLNAPAPDLSPLIKMIEKMEPKVIQIEKDRKPKAFRVTVTKRAFNGLIEEFECKEITDGS